MITLSAFTVLLLEFRSLRASGSNGHFLRSLRGGEREHFLRSLRAPGGHFLRTLKNANDFTRVIKSDPELQQDPINVAADYDTDYYDDESFE